MDSNQDIALFPLGLVLLPGMIIPLHIFEDRYKEMISDCLKNDKEFGIVYYSGDQFNNTGCSAKIISVIKEYSDGRVDIIAEGNERFKVNTTSNAKAYLTANITYFDDEYELSGEQLEQAKNKGIALLNQVFNLYGNDFDVATVEELTPKVISFLIASNGGFTMEEKQFFLETINTRERLEKGVKSLQIIIDRLKVAKSIEKIIQSNGYLPKTHD